ncbi:MAG TPA: hypothetical protein VEN81_09260, partial [Planctomycetota bacterium]|nr:hypothetical protein [Planctomycetota bacterium]
ASCSSTGVSPETRAVAFLAREVPEWPARNRCFSCHNNGDGARALLEARRNSFRFDPEALRSTVDWLARPDRWKTAGPPGDASDRRLAVLQFAFALGSASEGEPAGPALLRACELLAEFQEPDGSWAVDSGGLPGSPVTYGRTLATVAARSVLARGGTSFAGALGRAEAWLRGRAPVTVVEAAALLLGPAGPGQLEACLELVRKGEAPGGGWGPYGTSPPEIFDTALVLLALAPEAETRSCPR